MKQQAKPVPKPVNVLLVATASAILHGVLAGIFIPLLAMLMLSLGALPAPLAAIATAEHGMMFAVAAPFGYAAVGFAGGALMAFLYNMFLKMLHHQKPPRKVVEPQIDLGAVPIEDAA